MYIKDRYRNKKNITQVRRGDIIWLDKKTIYRVLGENVQDLNRPYLVISNDTNNKNSPTIGIVSISSQTRKAKYPMHVYLSKEKYTNLSYDSIALVEQVKTINKDFVVEVSDKLDQEDINALNKAIFIQYIDETLQTKIV